MANETTVIAPLGGYQYIPGAFLARGGFETVLIKGLLRIVETVEPVNDRSLEPWTDCAAFQARVKKIHNSEEFKKKEQDAQKFFHTLKDFVFGRPTAMENMVRLTCSVSLDGSDFAFYHVPFASTM